MPSCGAWQTPGLAVLRSCRGQHPPQDASRTYLTILRSCGLAGLGNFPRTARIFISEVCTRRKFAKFLIRQYYDLAISLESAPFKHISRIFMCRRKIGCSINLTILRSYGRAGICTCRKTWLIVVRRPPCPIRFRSSTVMLLRTRPLRFKVSHSMSKSAACSQYSPLISGYCELAVVEIAIPLQADRVCCYMKILYGIRRRPIARASSDKIEKRRTFYTIPSILLQVGAARTTVGLSRNLSYVLRASRDAAVLCRWSRLRFFRTQRNLYLYLTINSGSLHSCEY